MDKFLNDALFEVVLEKAFVEHEKEELKFYPDDRELAEKYPISKKEVRRLRNIVKEKEYGKKLIRVYFDKASVVILCIISMFFALIMTSSEVRASVGNVILKWYEKYTEFVFSETSNGNNVLNSISNVKINYIPDGYELMSDDVLADARYLFFVHDNDVEKYITIDIFENESTSVAFDNEILNYERIDSIFAETWLMYDDKEGIGGVIIVEENISIKVFGYLHEEELFNIINSINIF